MSTKAFEQALDFMPEATASKSARKANGFWTALVQAIADGRSAEAEYRRQVSRGVEPNKAIKSAFHVGYGSR